MKKIKLTRNKIVIVDNEDFQRVSQYRWSLLNDKYATTWLKGLMHRFILGVSEGIIIDHINGNGLDNRKSNLRICSHVDNCRNRKMSKRNKSGYRGVHKSGNSWISQIGIDGKRVYLGSFATVEEAANAYDNAAKENYGEFARLNERNN